MIAALAAILGLGGLASPASASAPTEVQDVPVVSSADYRTLISHLKEGGAVVRRGLVTTDVPGYGKVSFADPDYAAQTAKGGSVTPSLGGGWSGWSGPYVSFDRTDQGALLAGGGAALAAAICLIPAVGQAACVAAAAIVAAAFYSATEYGRCPTSRPNLRVYVWNRSKIGCYR